MNLISRRHAGCFRAPLKVSASPTSASGWNPPSVMTNVLMQPEGKDFWVFDWGYYLVTTQTYVTFICFDQRSEATWSPSTSWVHMQAGHVLLAGWRWRAHTFPVSSLQADTSFFSDVFSVWCGTSVCGAARVASSTISLTELHWFICSDSQRNWPRLRWTCRWKPD